MSVTVSRFSDGSMSVTCAGQGMHLLASQALALHQQIGALLQSNEVRTAKLEDPAPLPRATGTLRVLRVSAFADQANVAQLEVVAIDDPEQKPPIAIRFAIPSAHQVLDTSEKLRLVGTSMLRFAPRPTPEVS